MDKDQVGMDKHNGNEIDNLMNIISNPCKLFGKYDDIMIIAHMISNYRSCIISERPDIIFEYNGIKYGVEHFEISPFYNKRKGDMSKKTIYDALHGRKIRDTLESSYEKFEDSFMTSYYSHAEKFNAYKKAIGSDGKLILLIEFRAAFSTSGDCNSQSS